MSLPCMRHITNSTFSTLLLAALGFTGACSKSEPEKTAASEAPSAVNQPEPSPATIAVAKAPEPAPVQAEPQAAPAANVEAQAGAADAAGLDFPARNRTWAKGVGPAACSVCREKHCRKYEGIDLVAGCLEKVNSAYGAPASDANFVADCRNIVACSQAAQCGYDEVKRAAGCYCGSASIDECAQRGPVKAAPCAGEWHAGVRSFANTDVQTRFTDLTYPAGWAYALLDCDREFCLAECSGKPAKKAHKN